MGPPTLGFEALALLVGELQGGAIVDRRQAAGELALAAELEFLGGLVGRVEPPRLAQAAADLDKPRSARDMARAAP